MIREVLAASGAGGIGNYDSCSFSSRGIGRFRPLKGAEPAIGSMGELVEVDEERIEVVAREKDLSRVLQAVTSAHPYEEPAIHLWKMENYKNWSGVES